ncbi:cobalt/nickel transport protein [Herbihabitans rhizosphaerae]|uniref:Cobalt/nickel transport protein n=1 Tax=Herbihabitans rhizosphaerae TaxID=1872711 RepID=A0A4V2ERV8_9PSEU|nr:PDGLE domain-containing protein [Herbihabitans rhizosphaerae]RZS34217.1 cobalt/nickel transport protein [Herbihabitans rhizosphaerae]
MSDAKRRGLTVFFAGFAFVALVLAGAVSYLADSDPDGLDHATQKGCTVSEVDGKEQLDGQCVAQSAKDHALADGPMADYKPGGSDGLTGLAGVVGVVATFAVAGGLFWLLRKRSDRPEPSSET